VVPVIQGYVQDFAVFLNEQKVVVVLITRRSCKKAGTRFLMRGLDDEGHVANFCETEQILYYQHFCLSHVQVRGSVPLFWTQVGLTTKTELLRSAELTAEAFLKHFERLKARY